VALAEDGKRRKLPDHSPDGHPTLVPVRTPLEGSSKAVQPLRKAVGAEDMTDADARLREFNTRSKDAQDKELRAPSGFDVLHDWAERDGGNEKG